ncbi:MAG: hypothetical protein EU539_03700, partial [Promethearchaeota archaeon]
MTNFDIEELHAELVNSGILTEDQIEAEIKKKAREFQGFMSMEAILYLIAKENGIIMESSLSDHEIYQVHENEFEVDYDELTIKISDIQENMSSLVLLGKIEKVYETRTFAHKNGTPGMIGSFILNDGSARIKVNLWNDQTEIIKNEFFKENVLVRIINAYPKLDRNKRLEINLGKKGQIILAPDDVDYVRFPLLKNLNLSETTIPQKIQIRDLHERTGFIPHVEGVVAEIISFDEKMLDKGTKTFLLKFLIKDESGIMHVIAWDMIAVTVLKQI